MRAISRRVASLSFDFFCPDGDPILIEQAQSHYPAWKFTYSLRKTLEEIYRALQKITK